MGTLDLIFVFSCLALAGLIGWPSLKGAPYLPAHRRAVDLMVREAKISGVTRAVDLGSGDGNIVIALAKEGIESDGYEINPLLVLVSRFRIRKLGLQQKSKIYWADFWNKSLSGYDYVTIFGIGRIMPKVEKKFEKEAPKGALVASYAFGLPGQKLYKKEGGVFFYKKD